MWNMAVKMVNMFVFQRCSEREWFSSGCCYSCVVLSWYSRCPQCRRRRWLSHGRLRYVSIICSLYILIFSLVLLQSSLPLTEIKAIEFVNEYGWHNILLLLLLLVLLIYYKEYL